MEPFCKLRDPAGYRACPWDLVEDAQGRSDWINVFESHTESLLAHARTSDHPPTEAVLSRFAAEFTGLLRRLRNEPAAHGSLDIFALCKHRAELMRRHGVGDPYDRVKRDENQAALRLLPEVLSEIDACGEDNVVETLLRGILAGNKFDLGAQATMDEHAAGGIDFLRTLDALKSRPWFVDHVVQLTDRLRPGACTYQKAMFFVDNAGSDVVLGAVPLARYLTGQGTRVVLAANDEPALNDILHLELDDVLDQACRLDAHLRDHVRAGVIATVGTGCDCPLIDLSAVSPACNAAARDADLVILEGMGRAIETNYSTPMTCDCLRLAMIKNPHVAEHIGCDMFDLVVKFDPASPVAKGDRHLANRSSRH